MSNWARIGAVLVTVLCGCTDESEKEAAGGAGFVVWTGDHAIPLPEPDADAGELADIAPIVADAKVLALGEPAYGAREPLAFRNQLFRYLVEHQGFTAIAIESGFTESRHVFQFVNGGPGDARDIVRENLTRGFGEFDQNLELVRWLRDYNAGNGRERKVRFYGIDLPGGSNGAFPNARVALEELLDYFQRTGSPLTDELRGEISPSLDHFTHDGYASVPEADRQRLRRAITVTLELMEDDRDAPRESDCDSDKAWARRNALTALGLERIFRMWPPGAGGEEPAPEPAEAMALRERIMAEQLRWVLKCEGEDGRILLVAHNAHLSSDSLESDDAEKFDQSIAPMGGHLRAALGNGLKILRIIDASLPRAEGDAQTGDEPTD